jgi:uncharacterized phage protein gp47/JayE
MSFGITPTGFVPKRLQDIVQEIQGDIESTFGPQNFEPDSVWSNFISPFAAQLSNVWDAGQATYNSVYPNTAEDVSLENAVSYIDVRRLAEKQTIATVQASGVQGTVLPIGRVVSVPQTGERFQSTAAVTIDDASAVILKISINTVADLTAYTITLNGTPYSYFSDASATAQEIVDGLIAALVPSISTGTDNGDQTLTVTADDLNTPFNTGITANLTIDQVSSNMPVEAEQFGEVLAVANTLTQIETPISGWVSANNGLPGILGRQEEEDPDLRIRYKQSANKPGSASLDAIRANLLNVEGVLSVSMEENVNDTISPTGLPPHSFSATIAGGLDQDIGDKIFEIKSGGIRSFGDIDVIVTDSQGEQHIVSFNREIPVQTWMRITITLDPEDEFPLDGEEQVAQAVLDFGNTLDIGEDIIPQKFVGPVFSVGGILSVVSEASRISAIGPFFTTPIKISPSERASFALVDIQVIVP